MSRRLLDSGGMHLFVGTTKSRVFGGQSERGTTNSIDQRPSHLRVVVNVLLYIEESFGLFLEQFHTSAATGLQQNSDAFSV